MPVQNDIIKKFVKDTLGCGCSDEVFKKIDIKNNVNVNKSLIINTRLVIGERLLIYLINIDDVEFIKNNLDEYINSGREERDKQGLNRFRLVLLSHNADSIGETAENIFKDNVKFDDRIFLHVLKKADITISE
ncbi:hypothetical protein ACFL20_02715 [Spirochaetota bacterium]